MDFKTFLQSLQITDAQGNPRSMTQGEIDRAMELYGRDGKALDKKNYNLTITFKDSKSRRHRNLAEEYAQTLKRQAMSIKSQPKPRI